jgi:hypothetical protein
MTSMHACLSPNRYGKELDGWPSCVPAAVGEGSNRSRLSDVLACENGCSARATDEWECGIRAPLQLALIVRAAGTVDVNVIKLKGGAVVV